RGEAANEARSQMRAELGVGDLTAILFVAHNFRVKGLRELIEAMKLLDEATLLVAGGDKAGPYEKLAQKCGIDVHFIGTQYAMANLYAAADVLGHPTWYDPCSRVVLEALIAGLPV